jgi:SAM-dependent methyltransferase
MYEDKQDWYYGFLRRDIEPLLPAHSARTLEIGCGGGVTLEWLKRSGRTDWVAGIEPSREAAAAATARVDQLLHGTVEERLAEIEPASLDLVLCLDVLEHLVDPWSTLRALQPLLRPGARIIVSLPNVRHHSVLLPLLLRGEWRYTDAGIMDRTHLRFFTLRSARRLLSDCGFQVAAEAANFRWQGWDRRIDRDSLGHLRGLLATQHLLCATHQSTAAPPLVAALAHAA